MHTIQQFHINHDYVVVTSGIKNECGCVVRYPKNIFKNLVPMQTTYLIDPPNATLSVYISDYDSIIETKNIQASRINIRLLVIQDVFLTSYKRDIYKDLIMASDNQTLFQMLAFEQTEEEKLLEAQLCDIFRDMLDGNVPSSNIEGYAQLVSYFESGGL